MERKVYFILTYILLFVGCATTQNKISFTDNTFFCENPKLKVQILKNVLKQNEKSMQGSGWNSTRYLYKTGPEEIVGITIWRFRHASNKEWRSSNEQLVRRIGALPLEPITINNETWVKYIKPNQQGFAIFGYFRRMDYNLVTVYSIIKAEQYKDDIKSFSETRVVNERLKRLINKAFNDIENMFVIG